MPDGRQIRPSRPQSVHKAEPQVLPATLSATRVVHRSPVACEGTARYPVSLAHGDSCSSPARRKVIGSQSKADIGFFTPRSHFGDLADNLQQQMLSLKGPRGRKKQLSGDDFKKMQNDEMAGQVSTTSSCCKRTATDRCVPATFRSTAQCSANASRCARNTRTENTSTTSY